MWMRSLLGKTVLDLEGAPAGRVVDTYPTDGSSPELAVVRVGRFGAKVLVSLNGVRAVPGGLQFPYTRIEIEDAPSTESARYEDERLSIARGYWSMRGGGRVAAPADLLR